VSDPDDVIARVTVELSRPVPLDSHFDARVMARVRAERRHAPRRRLVAWGAGALAVAASIAVMILFPRRATVAFELTAPEASSVALVGDFNDWNAGVTPLKRAQANGRWEVTVPLAPGQYNYAFVVDGARWLPDPSAPRASGDDFGKPNSVVTVTGRSL
jgi:hypothetical protein